MKLILLLFVGLCVSCSVKKLEVLKFESDTTNTSVYSFTKGESLLKKFNESYVFADKKYVIGVDLLISYIDISQKNNASNYTLHAGDIEVWLKDELSVTKIGSNKESIILGTAITRINFENVDSINVKFHKILLVIGKYARYELVFEK